MSLHKSFSADVFGQEGAPVATCNNLDELIQRRNTARVSNCRTAGDCLSFTCNINGIGQEASAEVYFAPCNPAAVVRVNYTTNEGVMSRASPFEASGDNTPIEISDTTFLDIFVKEIAAGPGLNFGVSVYNKRKSTAHGIGA